MDNINLVLNLLLFLRGSLRVDGVVSIVLIRTGLISSVLSWTTCIVLVVVGRTDQPQVEILKHPKARSHPASRRLWQGGFRCGRSINAANARRHLVL